MVLFDGITLWVFGISSQSLVKMDTLKSIRIKEEPADCGCFLENSGHKPKMEKLSEFEVVKIEPYYPDPNSVRFLPIFNEEPEDTKLNVIPITLLSTAVKPEIKPESVDFGIWNHESPASNNGEIGCAEPSTPVDKLKVHHSKAKVSSIIVTPSEVMEMKFETGTYLRDDLGDVEKKSHQCIFCETRFSKKFDMKQHLLIHTGGKPYECDDCGKAFTQKIDIQRHILIHTGEKPYKCSVCRMAFRLKANMKSHMLIHTGEKPYECNVCRMAFKQKPHLKKHMLIHLGEKPHECSICRMAFKRKSYLQKHVLIHTGKKLHECSVCRMAFTQKANMQRHKLIHTGEKAHECSICKQAFKQKSYLKRHMLIHTGVKPHKCSVCRVSFKRKPYLKKHMLIHIAGKPYKCND